jgi:chromatin assembly factor 1 subunit B
MVRVAPVKYELRKDTDQNLSELPYRMIFAVMCAESIFFFDTQTEEPIGFVYDMSYDNLTSISWSPDGRILAVSSLEGFNTFLQIRTNELVPTELIIERPISPPLKKQKEPKPEAMEFNVSF